MRCLGRFFGFWIWVWAAVSAPVSGSLTSSLPTDTTIVQITVESFLEHGTERGYAPIQVEIRNRLNRDEVWTLLFRSEQDGISSLDTRYHLEVEASSIRRFALLVPIAPNVKTRHHRSPSGSLQLRALGPGTQAFARNILSPNWSSHGSDRCHVGLSQSVALQMKEPLKQSSDNQRRDLSLHSLDLSLFPRDDRGLSGLDVLVLNREEWKSADLPTKSLERWIALGGHLFILNSRPGDQLPQRLGLGRIHALKSSPMPNQVNELYQTLGRIRTIQKRLGDRTQYLSPQWNFSDRVKPIIPSFGLFMMVVVVIAALLGPLNLWWGFRKKNIMRVLWTTPALSLGLSLLVGLGIVLSDGFGGAGVRSLWVMLLPEEQLEVKLQEQVSRTGVLLGNRFTLPQGVRMLPVRVQNRQSQTMLALQEQSDGTRAGGWFANRRIQGQVLEQVRTSRARLELTAGPAGPPVATTTIGVPFTTLLIRDRNGTLWKAEGTQPGREITLSLAQDRDLRDLFSDAFNRKQHPGNTRRLENGWFIAVADSGHGEWIPSLGSIDWEDRPVVYTGPVVQTGRQP